MKLLSASVAILMTSGTLCLAAKGSTKTVIYVDVPMHNSLPDLPNYKLANSGATVVDIAIISASVIGKNKAGKVVATNPSGTQQVLDNAGTNIKPLQAKGIKVLLSLTGNCEGVGISSFTNQNDADAFADSVKDIITKYNLDGVDLDDEYSKYQGAENDQSAVMVINALHNKMPNKIVSLFDYCYAATSVSKSQTVHKSLSYAWNAEYGTFSPPDVPGLSASNEAAASVEFYSGDPQKAANLAQMTVQKGYGAFVIYSLYAGDQSSYLSHITQQLYGEATKYTGSSEARSLSLGRLAPRASCSACS